MDFSGCWSVQFFCYKCLCIYITTYAPIWMHKGPVDICLLHVPQAWLMYFLNAVNSKIARFVLEMWFRWHQSLWIHRPAFIKVFLLLVFLLQVHCFPCLLLFCFWLKAILGFIIWWLACRTFQRLEVMIFHYQICLYSLWIQQQSSRLCKMISNYKSSDTFL